MGQKETPLARGRWRVWRRPAVRQRARAASRAVSSAHGRGWHGRQTAEVAAVGCVAEVGRGAGGRAEEAALEADEEVDEARVWLDEALGVDVSERRLEVPLAPVTRVQRRVR